MFWLCALPNPPDWQADSFNSSAPASWGDAARADKPPPQRPCKYARRWPASGRAKWSGSFRPLALRLLARASKSHAPPSPLSFGASAHSLGNCDSNSLDLSTIASVGGGPSAAGGAQRPTTAPRREETLAAASRAPPNGKRRRRRHCDAPLSGCVATRVCCRCASDWPKQRGR